MSYYRLSLMDFLKESHPERLSDGRFISSRAEAAAETYAKEVLNGSSNLQADHEARQVLFEGLYFSNHDTIVNILRNEFSMEIPETEAKDLAIKLLPELEPVFSGYALSDDAVYEPEYDLLYTELTGTIALYLESHELQ